MLAHVSPMCIIAHQVSKSKSGSDVMYVMRVEDVETGLQWVVHRRYSDFYALHEDLERKSKLCADCPFPAETYLFALQL